jgi:hypothetical protein
MTTPVPQTAWQSDLVELLRHGGDIGILRRGDRYLVAHANEPVREVPMELDEGEFLTRLELLRYARDATEDERDEALATVTGVVTRMLELGSPTEDVQVDLVLTAQELLALPFEAALGGDGKPLVLADRPRVEITRRVRGTFRDHTAGWPSKPKVLFVAADPEQEVPAEAHKQALRSSLQPWIEPLKGFPSIVPDERGVLTIIERATLGSMRKACESSRYTHVHILAHGCLIAPGLMQKYAVKLHADDGSGAVAVSADDLVGALSAGSTLPTIVTLTACDSGNVGSPVVAGSGLAHALHAAGISVVLGSQFPLTVPGSTLTVESFYSTLFAGGDVRDAIHAARRAVYNAHDETGHDWMSLVGYVQLPEGYADRLVDARLEAEFASLKTAQVWADEVARHAVASPEAYDRIADRLRTRIASLEQWAMLPANTARKAALDENRGLLGSAYKRLAELLHNRASIGDEPDRWQSESHRALQQAREWYGGAYAENLSAHWLGTQQLSLEAVLDGRIAEPWKLDAALSAAETACAREDEYWACGSRAELHLLAPYAGRDPQPEKVVEALRDLKTRGGSDTVAIDSTARQLARYLTWWTSGNGFFGDGRDLAADVAQAIDTAGREDWSLAEH